MTIKCIVEISGREFVFEAKCYDYISTPDGFMVCTPAGTFDVKRFA